MIEAIDLTKRYGDKTVVDSISFRAEPGTVTGFLGPNGAGKSTTMRMIVGLDRPTSGRVTVNGHSYVDSRAPLHEASALLDAKAVHPGRTARDHLRIIARTHGIPDRRVDEILDYAGLSSVARKKVGTFSLGMGQRVGIAAALLADPKVVILDEPVNGLDPEGVIWVRTLARDLAARGRTVLLSSHLMAEMAQTADRVIVLGRGRIIADAAMEDVLRGAGDPKTRVRSDDMARFARVLEAAGAAVTVESADTAVVDGPDSASIARMASTAGVILFEIAPVSTSLEEAFFALTDDTVEYRTTERPSR